MTYKIEWVKKAEKYFLTADAGLKKQFDKKVKILIADPYNTLQQLDIEIMKGRENVFRRRIGEYRIIYTIFNDILVVLLLDIDSRGDIYKRR